MLGLEVLHVTLLLIDKDKESDNAFEAIDTQCFEHAALGFDDLVVEEVDEEVVCEQLLLIFSKERLEPVVEYVLVVFSELGLLSQELPNAFYLSWVEWFLCPQEKSAQALQPTFEILEVGKWVVVRHVQLLVRFDCEVILLDESVRELDVVAEVTDDKVVYLLSSDEILSEFLSCPSVGRGVHAWTHPFDQLHCDLEILQRQSVVAQVVDRTGHVAFLQLVVPAGNLRAEFLACQLCCINRIWLLLDCNRPQELRGLLNEGLWLSEADSTFLAKLNDKLNVLLDQLGCRHIHDFVDEVLLGRVRHAVVGGLQHLEHYFVDLELDLLPFLVADQPDHVNLTFFDFLFVEEQPDQILRPVNKLEMRVFSKHVIENGELPQVGYQLLAAQRPVQLVSLSHVFDGLVDVFDALDPLLQVGHCQQGSADE